MAKPEFTSELLERIAADDKLTPAQMALLVALHSVWASQRYVVPYRVSRRILMKKSRIKSYATYHKILRDLQHFEYIEYSPSYHPTRASQVRFLHQDQVIKKTGVLKHKREVWT